jgi:uncharacterized protein YndB with AHSA1/START domain
MTVEEIAADPGWLRMRADMVGMTPAQAWRAWTDAAQLTRWWPPDAELDVRVGGEYRLSWPRMNWHLRGRYTMVEPGRTLEFTWTWDHEPERPERLVTVDFEALAGGTGTRLTITHGPYGEGEAEAEDRQGHVDGWTQFLGRLADLKQAS